MKLEDLFGEIPSVDLSESTCHSGGAKGADTYWEEIGEEFGVKTRAYSYKTDYHTSKNKVEISEEDYLEGIEEVNKANYRLNRYGIHKYMNLLARDWSQIKHSHQVFTVGYIVHPGKKGRKGYYSKSKYQVVDGGTGYGVQMAINHNKDVFVFNLSDNQWYMWSYAGEVFSKCDVPYISNPHFAGIGTRDVTQSGIDAIRDVYEKTLKKHNG